MRVGPDDFFHLTYCTNIHPGETWPEVKTNLEQYTLPLKKRISPNAPFGVGLRLSNAAARHLAAGNALSHLRAWLDEHGLYVFTLNGFPYGGFHRQVVKDHVYEPDWRAEERVDYTMCLIDVLEGLLPHGMEGSISTSPLSYKPWLSSDEADEAFRRSARNLVRVAARLHEIYDRSGTLIHLGIEPEPDCLIENTDETIAFFENRLLPAVSVDAHLTPGTQGVPRLDEESLLRHIRLCYDACHFAVEFDDPEDATARFDAAGIRISKLQLSSALRVDLNENRRTLAEDLRPFAESTYLHQVVARNAGGSLHRFQDLPLALSELETDPAEEWRVHYHVPIFLEGYGRLSSTQSDLSRTLDRVIATRSTDHLEIETYTWDVLPDRLKTDVVTSIEREYDWVRGRFPS